MDWKTNLLNILQIQSIQHFILQNVFFQSGCSQPAEPSLCFSPPQFNRNKTEVCMGLALQCMRSFILPVGVLWEKWECFPVGSRTWAYGHNLVPRAFCTPPLSQGKGPGNEIGCKRTQIVYIYIKKQSIPTSNEAAIIPEIVIVEACIQGPLSAVSI